MLKGHVFNNQYFGNHIFALFMNIFLAGHNGVINGYKNSMQITYSGSNVTVGSGALCVQGRFLEEDSSYTVNAGTNTLYNILVLTIDLDKENTESNFQQGYYEILTGSSSYPTLTKNDIVNTNSGKYQYELARFQTSLNGITNFVDSRTFLDFDSIYQKLEEESDIVFEDELTNKLANYVTTAILNSTLSNYLLKSGGAMSGDLISQTIRPRADKQYDLGTGAYLWKDIYMSDGIHSSGGWQIYGSSHTLVLAGTNGATVRANADLGTYMPISASAFNVHSSKRYKKNIKEMTEEEADKILDIDAKVFDYKNEKNGTNVAGFIAEEVYEVLPNLVTLANIDGKYVPDSVDYSKFVPYLLKEIQILKKEVYELKGNK